MEAVLLFFKQGGVFMYPILCGALWAFVLLIERAIFYLQTASRLGRQAEEFRSVLLRQGIDEAGSYIASQKGILRNVLVVALQHRTLPVDRVEEKMGLVVMKDLPEYHKYLNIIAVLAGLMPMLGLLGTVSGMIVLFKVIALRGTGDAQAMADGISQALLTTEAGLVAAIPIIIGHVLLTNRLNKITAKTKEVCLATLDYLKEHHA
ncbi:MAG: MotA/TolQ/ExbB proton channel family protein [Chitinispirillaceae bacterium]|nr:MotA/TolQ/ExbB proton channel family protein [Chitinispirillaceae bacterium]